MEIAIWLGRKACNNVLSRPKFVYVGEEALLKYGIWVHYEHFRLFRLSNPPLTSSSNTSGVIRVKSGWR